VRFIALIYAMVAATAPAYAQQAAPTYNWTGLSADDIQIIGRGLDKLPREDTDRNNLYQRLQSQITTQANAFAKAKADADKAALDKAIEEATKAKDAPKTDQP